MEKINDFLKKIISINNFFSYLKGKRNKNGISNFFSDFTFSKK